MRNKVIIGANFGDEGKGLITDYCVSQFNGDCIVVRFNGGAQAGHTVVTPQGRRHKFSHIGSGAFFGTPTYLSRFFITNPMLFMKEFDELSSIPIVYIDENSLVSTPYDMYLNHLRESLRGEGKHGSCGIGINETVRRSEEKEFCLRVKDFRDDKKWKNIFKRIAEEYFLQELEKMKCTSPIFNYDLFIEIFKNFIRKVFICNNEVLEDKNLVFEGAQGLLLDQNHSYFPHVTRSNTGFENAKALLEETCRNDDETEVIYVSRSYITRHGRGPFPAETIGLPYKRIIDDTNVFNEYQENLRFGIIDVSSFVGEIKKDMVKSNLKNSSIAITCLDQVDNGMIKCYLDGFLVNLSIEEFIDIIKDGFQNVYMSFGETRDSIKE